MKKTSLMLLIACVVGFSSIVTTADDYVVDVKGAHAFVKFKASHLGYSWLYGDFSRFGGEFTYDPKNDSKNKVEITVDTTSLNSNHSERDKHLRDKEFLNASKFPEAKFVSTSYKTVSKEKAILKGKLTLMGFTKEIEFDVDVIGGGKDPWGGYRYGFEARTMLKTKDFGMDKSEWFPEVELIVSVEGCKKPNKKCA